MRSRAALLAPIPFLFVLPVLLVRILVAVGSFFTTYVFPALMQ